MAKARLSLHRYCNSFVVACIAVTEQNVLGEIALPLCHLLKGLSF